MSGLAAQFQGSAQIRPLRYKVPLVKDASLYSVELREGDSLYWVFVFCGCVPENTLSVVRKLLSRGTMLGEGELLNALVGDALRRLAKHIGYTVDYFDPPTVH